MNQEAYQEITKMLNAFPQSAADLRGLLLTYDEDTTGIQDQAIIEAAQRYRRGIVADQNRTFAPSVAEFCTEARRIAELLPYRGVTRLSPPPKREYYREPSQEERARMGFKMAVLSAGLSRSQAYRVKEANDRGLEEIVALGQEWGVPVPESVFAELKKPA